MFVVCDMMIWGFELACAIITGGGSQRGARAVGAGTARDDCGERHHGRQGRWQANRAEMEYVKMDEPRP